MMNLKQFLILKIIILIILVALSIVSFPFLLEYYEDAENLVRGAGIFGPIIYMILLIIGILVSPIPTSPLAIMAGIIFGPLLGLIYTLIGATIGAVLAFLIARFLLRDFLKKHFGGNKFYDKIKGKNNKNVAYFVFVTRLMPQISFDLVSYLAGITSLNIFTFAIVTFIGMIPIVFLLTFFGYLIASYISTVLIVLFVAFIAYIIFKIITTE